MSAGVLNRVNALKVTDALQRAGNYRCFSCADATTPSRQDCSAKCIRNLMPTHMAAASAAAAAASRRARPSETISRQICTVDCSRCEPKLSTASQHCITVMRVAFTSKPQAPHLHHVQRMAAIRARISCKPSQPKHNIHFPKKARENPPASAEKSSRVHWRKLLRRMAASA